VRIVEVPFFFFLLLPSPAFPLFLLASSHVAKVLIVPIEWPRLAL